MMPDFDGAAHYALTRLENDLPPNLFYHGVKHTRDDVVPAAQRLAQYENIRGESRLLLLTAAWYHDVGFIERPTDNEVLAVETAYEMLPGFGYTPQHLQVIRGIIMATKWPQSPHTLLEQIMADADLDSLGRDDFLCTSLSLRDEIQATGAEIDLLEWYKGQIEFLSAHEYFTAAAHALRTANKYRNINMLEDLIAQGIPDAACE
ncbi:MAG: HD domain-containing protein [Chloroflexi bacterium]|nr:HD domain-containing protein [Chloroflexota bacterium]